MDNWAPFLRGYQSHQKQSDVDSVWVLKGDVGMMTRTVKFQVHVDEWGEPSLVRFTLKGVNEPMQGGGEFRLEPFEDASAASAVAPAPKLGWFARFVRWLYRLFAGRSERAAGANAGPGAGMARLSFRLRITPGGPMGPMVDALMKPLMLPVAEELADRIMAELEKRHAPKS
jgi:carbon monoxide dehydrogenase subunit G